MAVFSDVTQKAGLNFIVAVMAATTAVKGGTKLHTSIIRIGTQWISACPTADPIGLLSSLYILNFKYIAFQTLFNNIYNREWSIYRFILTFLYISFPYYGTCGLLLGSVLMEFNLERLPGMDWSKKEQEIAQLQECAAANASDCETSSEAGVEVIDFN